jgi:hypothetical protein
MRMSYCNYNNMWLQELLQRAAPEIPITGGGPRAQGKSFMRVG